MIRINNFITSVTEFSMKAPSPLVQIAKAALLLGFSQSASLFARAQVVRGSHPATAIARSAMPISVINPIPDQVVQPDSLFYLEADNTFLDVYNASITASAAGFAPLPTWVSFFPSAYSAFDYQSSSYVSITIAGNLAFATTEQDPGLEIIDISSPGNLSLLSTFPIGGYSQDVAVQGNIAYTVGSEGSNYTMNILNVTNPRQPTLISEFVLNNFGFEIVVQGSYAYVAISSGLQIVDITDPYHPASKGLCGTPSQGQSNGVAVSGNYAYIADGTSGLQVIEITNPSSPGIKGYYQTSNALQVTVNGELAFVADGNGGLQILSIFDPTAPSFVGKYQAVDFAAFDVQVSGNTAYVSDYFFGLRVLDITTPSNPVLMETYAAYGAQESAIQGGKVFMVSTLTIVNFLTLYPFHPCGTFWGTPSENNHGKMTFQLRATDANQKTVFDHFDLYVDRPPFLLSSIADQSIDPGQLINLFIDNKVVFSDPDLDPLSLSANSLPSWLSLINFPLLISYSGGLNPLSLAVEGIYAYLITPAELLILDIGLPSNPQLLSTIQLSLDIYTSNEVSVVGNLVYVAGGYTGLQIIDVSKPSAPFLVSNTSVCSDVFAIEVQGDTAFVACRFNQTVSIVNVADPYTPTVTGRYASTGYVFGVSVVGDLVFASSDNGLEIVDVTNLQNPQQIGLYSTQTSYKSAVVGNLAFISPVDGFEDGSFLKIIDITYPNNPTFAGEIPSSLLSTPGSEIVVIGDLLYTTGNNMLIFDISNVSNPLPVGISNYAQDIQIGNDIAYVTDGISFQIYDLSKWKIVGTPAKQDAGNYEISVIAKDPAKLSVADTFKLRVEGPPQFVHPIANQTGAVGTPITFFIDQTTFKDPNGDIISYSALLWNKGQTSPLPYWLHFSPSGIFTGIPGTSDAKIYTIQVTAFDGIVPPTDSTNFDITIVDNIGRQSARIEGQFYYSLNNAIVQNPQGPVTYSATQSDGSALPAWLSFNTATATFTGTPQEVDKGTITIFVTGNDGVQLPTTVSFTLVVNENQGPHVVSQLSNQVANVKVAFSYVVPGDTFADDDGDALTYTASQLGGHPLPGWLNFDTTERRFHGTPGRGDTGPFGPAIVPIQVTASDGQLQASTAFSLSVQGVSNVGLALSIIGPATTVAGFFYAWYKKRGVILNYWREDEYRRPKQTIKVGTHYSHQLDVVSKKVKLVQAVLGKKVHCNIMWPSFLSYCLSYNDPLPGNVLLPAWLEYDCNKNILRSKILPEDDDVGVYVIQVYKEAQLLANEFELEVERESQFASKVEETLKPRKKTIIPFDSGSGMGVIDV